MTTASRSAHVSAGMLAFLLHGIGSGCQRCREHCIDTLRAIGNEAIPDLRHLAERTRLTPGHSRRLATTLEELAECDGTAVNPIPGLFHAMLALVDSEWEEDVMIRGVGMVGGIVGRHIAASVLMDELSNRYDDQRYARRLINAAASIRDALSAAHLLYLRQVVTYAPLEVAWFCARLVEWIENSNPDDVMPHDGFHDPAVKGLRLLDWLTRAAVVGSDTAVRDPEWIWLRDFRYRPMIVNPGPILTVQSSKVDVQFASCGPA